MTAFMGLKREKEHKSHSGGGWGMLLRINWCTGLRGFSSWPARSSHTKSVWKLEICCFLMSCFGPRVVWMDVQGYPVTQSQTGLRDGDSKVIWHEWNTAFTRSLTLSKIVTRTFKMSAIFFFFFKTEVTVTSARTTKNINNDKKSS